MSVGRPANVRFDSLVVRDLLNIAAVRCDQKDLVVGRVFNALVNWFCEECDLLAVRCRRNFADRQVTLCDRLRTRRELG